MSGGTKLPGQKGYPDKCAPGQKSPAIWYPAIKSPAQCRCIFINHTDSVEHFDDFRRRKSGQNDDFRGRFYAVAEFASLGAENGYCLTIFGTENRAKMTILGTNR